MEHQNIQTYSPILNKVAVFVVINRIVHGWICGIRFDIKYNHDSHTFFILIISEKIKINIFFIVGNNVCNIDYFSIELEVLENFNKFHII